MVEFLREKDTRSFEDLIRFPKLRVLSAQTPVFCHSISRDTWCFPCVDLGLVVPDTERVGRDTQEPADVSARNVEAALLGECFGEHAQRALTELWIIFSCHSDSHLPY